MEDFLEEYTGDKNPSYCSGYGWNYSTYKEELEYVVEPIINSLISDCFKELKVLQPQIISEIIDKDVNTCSDEDTCDEFYDYLWYNDICTLSYMQDWKELLFSDILRLGEFSAKKRINEEIKFSNYKELKDTEYKITADELFKRYIVLCSDKVNYIANNDSKYTGHQFGKRDNVLEYIDKTIYNGIKDILNNNFSKKELTILSRYRFITTNSVKSILEFNIDWYSDDN